MLTAERTLPHVETYVGTRFREALPHWHALLERLPVVSPSIRPEWATVLHRALQHEPYCVVAESAGTTSGVLPLALVQSRLFGRFLVSLPYLNIGGVIADDDVTAQRLIDRALQLADKLNVRYLELRHERPILHASFNYELTSKVHMRLDLPPCAERLWNAFEPKVRSQIRKATKNGLSAEWGAHDKLTDFYAVFATNMRDLGTPVFGRALFENILDAFGDDAEICVIRQQTRAVAAGLLLHGRGVAEVPSASSLRRYNSLNGNMLLYWSLLTRAIERRQRVFDFGRCTHDGSTYRFKKQWGAVPHSAVWQYYVRRGSVEAMRADSTGNRRKAAVWRRLPVWLTRILGPPIVRGIP